MMISIIANFYKSEKYIPKLIDSVLSQNYTDWELVCVNDCSPGNDLEILRKYAAKDSRIRIVNNEVNLGICKAKYRGIQEAKGTFLCFIDGDDWLEPEALQRMIDPALKYDLDFVCMDSQKVLPFFGHKVPFCVDKKYKERVIEIDTEKGEGRKNFEELYRNFFGKNLFMVTYWGKLIKKKLIEESGFSPPNSVISEDQVFTMTIFPYIKKMMFVDYIGYNWRWGGITSGKNNDFWKEKQYVIRANEFYVERLALTKKYNLPNYVSLLQIELRNVYCVQVASLAKEDPDTEYAKEIKAFIQEMMKPDFYSTFSHLKNDPEYPNNKNHELLDALINRDAERVYAYCRKIHKQNWIKHWINKILHSILYPFQR